ncbi:outer membrane protein assembly factor BamA [Chitinophaga skermanii]|uniref:Outer membrane protein assembly factor BamA n=1 Tax=Chitinophaga skermanii TaxID=331697 RepID=A0A327Q791_9BACT|nr:outer membrane protein assembly factor BamA [Chitinophaga skermanii]
MLVVACSTLFSCSNTKYLKDGQSLYVANQFDVKGELTTAEKQDLRSALSSKSLAIQQPQNKFLGTRLKVWLYNQKYNENKSNWFWNAVLSPKNLAEPVIYDSTRIAESVIRMRSYLENQGYFYATVDYSVNTKRKKTEVDYNVNTGKSFIIDTVTYNIPNPDIARIVESSNKLSLVKKNIPYKGETLSAERDRLMRVIRDSGYYKFNRDYISFVLDTVNKSLLRNSINPFDGLFEIFNTNKRIEKPTMDVEVNVEPAPEDTLNEGEKLYYVNKVYVYPDYSLTGQTVSDSALSEEVRKYFTMRYHQDIIRPRVLASAILIRPGDKYSIQNYTGTINKLYDLNVWQFVNLQYIETPGTKDSLDAYIYLTPKKKKELGLNFEVTTSSDYFIGSGFNINHRHVNLNRAANQLQIQAKAGVELVRNVGHFDVQSIEYGINTAVTLPRFVTPFFHIRQGNRLMAKTRIGAGVNYLRRVDKFDITNISGSFGYEWAQSLNKRWQLTPFNLTYVGVKLNPNFKATVVDSSPYLKRSFEPAFIGGEQFSFIYSNNDVFHKRQNSYFRVSAEEAGAWLKGINSLWYDISGKKQNLETLTGVKISQFVRLETEFKHYWNYFKSNVATRFYMGVGIPYGSSDVLPYIRQFTAGGPNSIRAFRLRTLGPGSYVDTSATAQQFPDQTGDMKLEGNVEYRFNLLRMFGGSMYVRGATFLDFGNIWMLKTDTTRPGAAFEFKNLYKDLAIGTGVGLRLDFSFFLVRLDWGIPLKKPYSPTNPSGWYIKDWELNNATWRRNNIIWNIAIGYPF